MSPETANARKAAVQILYAMLQHPAADSVHSEPTITADYIRLLIGNMASHEVVAMADWQYVAKRAKDVQW